MLESWSRTRIESADRVRACSRPDRLDPPKGAARGILCDSGASDAETCHTTKRGHHTRVQPDHSILSFIGAVIALVPSFNTANTVKAWLSDDSGAAELSVQVAESTADSVYWLAVAVGLLVSIAFAVVPLWSRKQVRL